MSDNMTTQIPQDYVPIVYNIPTDTNTNGIFKYDLKPQFSKSIDFPKFSLGFQHYIHQSKDKMAITSEFEGKKKIYFVMNKFERYIDDYDTDIGNTSVQYFNLDLKQKPNILSRSFYKLWEILFMFDLINLNNEDFVSAHLAEGPGSFIQAVMFYRDLYCKKGSSKNDKYYAITLHAENMDKHIPKLEEKFINYYAKEKPVRVEIHKTYPIKQARMSKHKDNGDLTDLKTIKLFGGKFSDKKADLITADGGFDWVNENVQEQEAFKLLLGQIIAALNIQKKGGHFVCKFYESFANTTSKLINLLGSFYEKIHLVKPLTSRKSSSEKYAVCINYLDAKDNSKKIEQLEKLLEEMNRKNINLVDFFPEYHITDNYKAALITTNTKIANKQFIAINEIVDFIKKQNYRGDEYQKRRNMQIDASKYWCDTFFPDLKDFSSKKKEIEKMISDLVEKGNKEIQDLKGKLDFS